MTTPDWRRDARCLGRDPEIWHSDRGEVVEQAKAICRPCPARERCLAEALTDRTPAGVWGGLTESERRPLLPAAKPAPGRVEAPTKQRGSCGSRSGYKLHRRHLEAACAPCLDANAKHGVAARLRRKAAR